MSAIGKMFGGGQQQQQQMPILPPPPPPPPQPMPDIGSKAAMEESRKKIANKSTGGRESTIMGSAIGGGDYAGRRLGQG